VIWVLESIHTILLATCVYIIFVRDADNILEMETAKWYARPLCQNPPHLLKMPHRALADAIYITVCRIDSITLYTIC
jgi:hypothetical protein